jgi:hypothetical protein
MHYPPSPAEIEEYENFVDSLLSDEGTDVDIDTEVGPYLDIETQRTGFGPWDFNLLSSVPSRRRS